MNWSPQPGPQEAFVSSEVFEVVYGGARGGGKTDAALGEFAAHERNHGAAARGLLVRRTRTALEPTLERARQIYGSDGAVWRESRSRFEWPSGATFYFKHLDNDADADLYQGNSYTRVYIEELTQFPSPIPVDKLKATLRSPAGVPCRFRATCNPGGAGHGWVKARYIDPGPWVVAVEEGLGRQFIPARLADNPRLLDSDPMYIARLKQSGSAELVKAWLDGDWSIVEGAFFDTWSVKNVVPPFKIPEHWTRIRSFDWGFASPFSVGWWAVASDTCRVGDGRSELVMIRRGALIRYREWYGANAKIQGVRLTAEGIAAGILERERGETIADSVADPSIFSHDGGPTIAERLAIAGCVFRPADNTRVGRAGALSGWDQLRARITGDDLGPMLFVFDTCRDFIRTVPVLQHDPINAEDVDTNAEDHIADEARYACLARPLIAPAPGSRWGATRRTSARWGESWKTT